MNFEDFEALFEIERESQSREHTMPSQPSPSLPSHHATDTTTSSRSLAYHTAFESFPTESFTSLRSPTGASALSSSGHTLPGERHLESRVATNPASLSQTDTPPVVLRHKRVGRRSTSTPVSGGQDKRGAGVTMRGGRLLSPIHGGGGAYGRPLSTNMPGKYITELSRSSC